MTVFLVIIALGLLWLAAYTLHGWVTAHALAVAVGEQWSIQAQGWAALWPTVAAGLLAGAVVGLVIGLVASGRIAEALEDKRSAAVKEAEKALQAQRLELVKRQAGIDAEIKKVADERIKSIKSWADNLALENEKLKDELLHLQRKTGIIEGRLKGAQQKAARFKKARLMSV